MRSGTENKKGLRLDIQGLRAVAVLLVLLAHANVPFFQGGFIGVDVFFVLSGFLITGLVIREIEKTGSVSFSNFYARRARRLLPLAATVLLFIAIVSLILFPVLRQIETGKDIVGAAFYFVNWLFAAQHIDYFAASDAALSPVRHFWSLSVEEQFYFVWPLGMFLCTLLCNKITGGKPRRSALLVISVVTLISFAYSIYLTSANPEVAYFSTLTRIWELGVGGILVLALPAAIRMKREVSDLLVGSGLLVVVGSAVLITEQTPFPGYAALAPILGTVLLLVGGASVVRGRVVGALLTAPMQHIGNVSYSLYLWHWPFIVFALAIWPEIGTWGLVLVVLASFVPTEISHRLIEKPIHTSRKLASRPKQALLLGLACSIIAAGSGFALYHDRLHLGASSSAAYPGAALIKGKVPLQQKASSLQPNPAVAKEDRGQAFTDGCLVMGEATESPECAYGDTSSDKTVVLLGDSRALQFATALDRIGKKQHWRLVVLTRADCSFADVDLGEECNTWRENALKRIEQEKPQLVVLGTANKYFWRLGAPESLPTLVDGSVRTIDRIKKTGADVVVMRDQSAAPWTWPAECIATNLGSLQKCAFRPADRAPHAFEAMAARETGVPTIDTQNKVCRPTLCPTVIGNVVVYKDGYHYSATFIDTLTPWLEKELGKVWKGSAQ